MVGDFDYFDCALEWWYINGSWRNTCLHFTNRKKWDQALQSCKNWAGFHLKQWVTW